MAKVEFAVKKREDVFCVVSGGDTFGKFSTEVEAEARLITIKTARDASATGDEIIEGFKDVAEPEEYASLSGVEIMRVGTWNGDKFTSNDLDDIVEAFDGVGFKPPVKLGHVEKSGDPAFGFVTGLKRVGDRLLADISDIPQKLADMIHERRFDAVSSEVFFNLKRGEKLFRRALKAVALLGAEIPAVAGLKPLRESLLENSEDTQAHFYSITPEELKMPGEDKAKLAAEKKAAEDAAEVKKLTEAVATLTTSLEAAEKKGTDNSATALLVQELTEKVAELTKENATSEETRRQEKIKDKVAKVPFPAFRRHFAALYSAVTSEDSRTAEFAVGDDDKVKISAEAVLDDLVKRLAKFATENITGELSHGSDFERSDGPTDITDPGAQLDAMAQAYALKEGVDYEKAFDVIAADPENAVIYAAYSGTAN